MAAVDLRVEAPGERRSHGRAGQRDGVGGGRASSDRRRARRSRPRRPHPGARRIPVRSAGAARQTPSGVTASRPSAPRDTTTASAPAGAGAAPRRPHRARPPTRASSSLLGLTSAGRPANPARRASPSASRTAGTPARRAGGTARRMRRRGRRAAGCPTGPRRARRRVRRRTCAGTRSTRHARSSAPAPRTRLRRPRTHPPRQPSGGCCLRSASATSEAAPRQGRRRSPRRCGRRRSRRRRSRGRARPAPAETFTPFPPARSCTAVTRFAACHSTSVHGVGDVEREVQRDRRDHRGHTSPMILAVGEALMEFRRDTADGRVATPGHMGRALPERGAGDLRVGRGAARRSHGAGRLRRRRCLRSCADRAHGAGRRRGDGISIAPARATAVALVAYRDDGDARLLVLGP